MANFSHEIIKMCYLLNFKSEIKMKQYKKGGLTRSSLHSLTSRHTSESKFIQCIFKVWFRYLKRLLWGHCQIQNLITAF